MRSKFHIILLMIIFSVCAVYFLGLSNSVTGFLKATSWQWRGNEFSLYFVFKALLLIVLTFSAALFTLNLLEKNINQIKSLNPSLKVVINKLIKVALLSLALVISLDGLGIDLTALTVFSGAIGIGIGFGLQKIFSNFISGIILLSDGSIKPGDVIGIGSTYGWVNALGARYVSIITRDGKEHLIPNETLITNHVENWSFSDTDVRVRIPLRVSYKANIHHALAIVVDVAKSIPRVLQNPEPKCLVRAFGPYAVELELRIWIKDPASGMGGIQSDILLGVLDRFAKEGLEIPVPTYDVKLVDPSKTSEINGDDHSMKSKTFNTFYDHIIE